MLCVAHKDSVCCVCYSLSYDINCVFEQRLENKYRNY